jgi:hypothetical protein
MMAKEEKTKKLIKKELTALCQMLALDPKAAIYMPSAGRYGRSGEPDFRVTLFGLELHVEAKSEVGRLRPSQVKRIKELRDCGAMVLVIKGQQEGANLLYKHGNAIFRYIASRIAEDKQRAFSAALSRISEKTVDTSPKPWEIK